MTGIFRQPRPPRYLLARRYMIRTYDRNMPLTIDLSVSELARTRFGISPLSETISGLQQLGIWRREIHRPWLQWAAGELAARPLGLPFSWPLVVTGRLSWPQFLLPAPDRAGTTIDSNLAAMQRTTAEQVRASLRRGFGDHLTGSAAELAADPAAGLPAIAAELRAAHDRLIAPHWPRIRAVLDADIAYRARRLADGGADALFADLHPDLRWDSGRLTLTDVARGDRVGAGAAPGGLVLVPVVLGPPYVLIKLHTTTQTTVRYPARGPRLAVGRGCRAGRRPCGAPARPAPGRAPGSAALPRDHHRPGPHSARHSQCGIAAPRRAARQRPGDCPAVRPPRAVPDHRPRPGPAGTSGCTCRGRRLTRQRARQPMSR
jgi:hypothetical protein